MELSLPFRENVNKMENISPEQINSWVATIWGLSWKGLLVFAVIYYRDLATHIGKTIIDVIASWLKRR